MVRMPGLSRRWQLDLTSLLEARTPAGALGLRPPTLRIEALLFRRPGRPGGATAAGDGQGTGQLVLQPLEGEIPVAGLGAGVLGDRGHHGTELADDPFPLGFVERERSAHIEDRFDP